MRQVSRLPALLAVPAVLGAVAYLALVGPPSNRGPALEEPDPGHEPGLEEPRAPVLVGLRGAGGRLAPRRPGGSPPAPASAADFASIPAPPAVAASAAAALDENAPIVPGEVDDQVTPWAAVPWALSRDDLIGERGRFAHGGGPDDYARRWLGVARLLRHDRSPYEAPDDTAEPVATAVLGRVLREDGSAVPGAAVILYTSFYLRQAYYDRRVREVGRVFTDAEGRFDLRPVDLDTVHFGRSGEVLVSVRHPTLADLVVQRLGGLAPGRESDVGALVLPEVGAAVSGTVLDLGGRPVPGAVVRASGLFNPVDYDKAERLIVLTTCPSAVTDEDGRYRLSGFAPGRHEVSVHVNLDCVIHVAGHWVGERTWSPRVRAGHGVIGRVEDEAGSPVAAAVVRGGGNWTPTNPDGTFWLDNVDPGTLLLDVSHHDFVRHHFPGVATDQEEPVRLVLEKRLARVTLEVVGARGGPVPLVEVAWTWAPGRGPDEFTPRSPRWHDPAGVFLLVVPDGVVGARVGREGVGQGTLGEAELADGGRVRLVLEEAATAGEDSVAPPG